jgi:glucose/arabinose dehydrogenase
MLDLVGFVRGGRRAFLALAGVVTLAGTACNATTTLPAEEDPSAGADTVQLERVAAGLSSPLHLTAPPSDPRLFVVEKVGRIRIIQNGNLLPAPFLDLTTSVSSGSEQGLLGVAFHPSYASNGFFYVDYTDRDGDTRVVRYRVSSDPNRADASSAKLLLAVDQPFSNHNGGLVVFGPDGMLYIGLGDGGSGGDPMNHGQDRTTLLGSILRIDVDRGDPYAIPADNPYVGNATAKPEIWAYGLRNPWRFSFDRTGGKLYIADVGQNAYEEVNAVDARTGGLNYGWNVMEGRHCFRTSSCNMNGLVLPVLEYGRGDGCSVTGGYVYRGAAMPSLRGHYFYSDYCNGWLRSFRLEGNDARDERQWSVDNVGSVLSFGEDASGELYMLSTGGGGSVYRLVRRP